MQNDKMFRCFLKMYPEYLKKHIVDTNKAKNLLRAELALLLEEIKKW